MNADFVSVAEFAKMMGVSRHQIYRLLRAELLGPDLSSSDYAYARLLLDLQAAGLSLDELRELELTSSHHRTAAELARRLGALLDAALPVVADRLERARRVREDIIRTREALLRCHACHKPPAALACRTCSAMPENPPRVLDAFFFPDDKSE